MSTAATATARLFSARGTTKHYRHVQALRGVDLDIYFQDTANRTEPTRNE